MSETTVFTLEKELKACGHYCFPSTTKNCCPCMDLRPHLEGNTYPVYCDGTGWVDTGARDDGYCPVCNPKNFDEWNARIEKTRREKALLKEQQLLDEEKKARNLEEDRRRAAAIAASGGEFRYTNGDVYEGEMSNGKRNGYGKMLYSDGSLYEGYWKDDLQEGYGVKNWGDGIVYVGEWKNDMMDGKGHYTMADGTVLEGIFQEDCILHH